MQFNLERLTTEQLSKLVDARRQELQKERDECEQQIAGIKAKALQTKQQVVQKVNETNYTHELVAIRNAERILGTGKEIIDTVASQSIIATVENSLTQDLNSYNIEALTVKVERTLRAVPDTLEISMFPRVVNFILLDIKSLQPLSPVIRIIAYLIYLGLIIVIFKMQPLVFIFPYSVMLICSLYKNITRSQKLVNFIYPYKLLEEKLGRLREDVRKQVEKTRSKEFLRIAKEQEHLSAPYIAKLQDLRVQMSQAEVIIRAQTSTEELTAAAKKDYETRIGECSDNIDALQTKLSNTHKFIESDKVQLANAQKRKVELQHQVAENYLNPKEPGDSRLLSKSFFLGFDDVDELIEFRYDGKTTIIIYKGINNGVNAPIITMLIMQLLAAMSIVSLRIAITDTRTGGTDYAVFSPKSLSNRIKICSINADVKKIIEEYHAELLMRNKDILTEAQTLEEYNERMLAKRSLTREYCFLFLQDPDLETLASQKFTQLCMSGPRVGIIPIVFIANAFINQSLKENNSMVRLGTFVQAAGDKFYVYDGSTQDITEQGKMRDSILDRIRPTR
ncbi:MAG: hypothetical protein RSC43_00420 [Clostridia bacterium]